MNEHFPPGHEHVWTPWQPVGNSLRKTHCTMCGHYVLSGAGVVEELPDVDLPVPRSRVDDRQCPDGGRCHHQCALYACFRVHHCGPLSGVYDNDTWPVRVRKTIKDGGTY